MTSAQEHPTVASLLAADGQAVASLVVLPVPVEWMRFCPTCERETRFVAEIECDLGLYAHCSSCGEDLIAPFTRMTARPE